MRVKVERESSGFVMLFPDPVVGGFYGTARVWTHSEWTRAVASVALDVLEGRGLNRRSVRFVHCAGSEG